MLSHCSCHLSYRWTFKGSKQSSKRNIRSLSLTWFARTPLETSRDCWWPSCTEQAREEGEQGRNHLCREPIPNQICKCNSSTKKPSRVLVYFLGSLSIAARPGCLSQTLWPQDAWAGHLNAGLASIWAAS